MNQTILCERNSSIIVLQDLFQRTEAIEAAYTESDVVSK